MMQLKTCHSLLLCSYLSRVSYQDETLEAIINNISFLFDIMFFLHIIKSQITIIGLYGLPLIFTLQQNVFKKTQEEVFDINVNM
jgi:uncharacterized membrane protein YozB (DUF420 family)